MRFRLSAPHPTRSLVLGARRGNVRRTCLAASHPTSSAQPRSDHDQSCRQVLVDASDTGVRYGPCRISTSTAQRTARTRRPWGDATPHKATTNPRIRRVGSSAESNSAHFTRPGDSGGTASPASLPDRLSHASIPPAVGHAHALDDLVRPSSRIEDPHDLAEEVVRAFAHCARALQSFSPRHARFTGIRRQATSAHRAS